MGKVPMSPKDRAAEIEAIRNGILNRRKDATPTPVHLELVEWSKESDDKRVRRD
jgi:hypothetical protein